MGICRSLCRKGKRMFNRRSSYALNKRDKDAIVCKSVTETHVRLTCDDFSSEEEFRRWKAWSDEDYRATERAERAYHDHGVPLEERNVPGTPSVEELLLEADGRTEWNAARESLALQIRDSLTEKQFRRLCLYYLGDLPEREIAEMEGVGQRRISTSLSLGRKKLARILGESG